MGITDDPASKKAETTVKAETAAYILHNSYNILPTQIRTN